MLKLHEQDCNKLTHELSALDDESISTYLQQLNPPWQLNGNDGTIENSYTFKNYYQTIAFVNVIAQVAHQQDHHPAIQVSYNRCTVSYSTHSVGGISIKDFICAAKINAAQEL